MMMMMRAKKRVDRLIKEATYQLTGCWFSSNYANTAVDPSNISIYTHFTVYQTVLLT